MALFDTFFPCFFRLSLSLSFLASRSKILVDIDHDGSWDEGKPLRVITDEDVDEEQAAVRARKIEKLRLERVRREAEAAKKQAEEDAKAASQALVNADAASGKAAAASSSLASPADVKIKIDVTKESDQTALLEMSLLESKAASASSPHHAINIGSGADADAHDGNDDAPLLKRMGTNQQAKNSFLDHDPDKAKAKDMTDEEKKADKEAKRLQAIEEEEQARLEEEKAMGANHTLDLFFVCHSSFEKKNYFCRQRKRLIAPSSTLTLRT